MNGFDASTCAKAWKLDQAEDEAQGRMIIAGERDIKNYLKYDQK